MMTQQLAREAVDEIVSRHEGSPFSALVLLLGAIGARIAQSEGRDAAVRIEIVTSRGATSFWADSFAFLPRETKPAAPIVVVAAAILPSSDEGSPTTAA